MGRCDIEKDEVCEMFTRKEKQPGQVVRAFVENGRVRK
jgi:hypothetical protein